MRPSSVLSLSVSVVLVMAVSLAGNAQKPSPPPASPQQPATAPAQSAPSQSTPPQPERNDPGAAPARPQTQAQSEEENPLQLTEEQKTKLRPILIEENQQMEALRNDTSLTQEQKIAKANAIREAASPKIKALLTPQQLQRLAEMQKARQNQPAQEQPPKK